MNDTDVNLIGVRSKQVMEVIEGSPEKWGNRNILFEPGVYDGDGKALVRPFKAINFVGHPHRDKPVVFRNFKLHDALFVNCLLKNNIKKGLSHGKPSLGHHLRIFNAVIIENVLSNCSTMEFENFLMLKSKKLGKPNEITEKSIVAFLRTYLSTMRKFGVILPDHRRDILPEYIQFRFKIFVTICSDGIVIWFRRPIGKKKDSIKVSTKRFLKNVIPILSQEENTFPVNGGTLGIRNLAIVTEGFSNSLHVEGHKMEGTVFKISDTVGILQVKSGADIKLENVLIGYLDTLGKRKQILLRGLWVIANDVAKFSVVESRERAQGEFFDRLVKSGPIKGEKMKRYSEADIAKEIDDVKKQYLSLILRDYVEEPELQKFLERHPFILSPTYLDICFGSLEVTPQRKLSEGKRVVDFLLLYELDFENIKRLITVVEIKRPSHKLFTRNGNRSKPLKEGLQQVKEVFRIFEENPQEAKRLGLHYSEETRGIVIIGRRLDLGKEENLHLNKINEGRARIRIITFDALIENIETVKNFYGAKGQQPVVVVGQKGTSDEDFTGKTAETIQRALDYLKKRIDRRQ